MQTIADPPGDHAFIRKWAVLILLSISVLLVMGTWFSASAVLPELTEAWGLGDSGRAWLTMSVQAGFVAGSLGSVLLNLADRVPPRLIIHNFGICRVHCHCRNCCFCRQLIACAHLSFSNRC